jgi:hypothetical protein
MKKLVLFAILLTISAGLALGLTSAAKECKYNSKFDKDKDYVMNSLANCSSAYEYDCDDSNKDTYKDCEKSVWQRIIDFFKGANSKAKASVVNSKNVITGNPIQKLLPPIPALTQKKFDPNNCSATICLNDQFTEIYCPLPYAECCAKYTECRVVACDAALCEADEEDEDEDEAEYPYDAEESGSEDADEGNFPDSGTCTEEYNDCYDNSVAVTCKGSFEDCSASFERCKCGTSETEMAEQATPDMTIDGSEECGTGVYVCDRKVVTMSGDVADSSVTCKGTFQRCSSVYGNCQCGNSTKTEFPTKYVGQTGGETCENDAGYWCDYRGKKIPCYMMPGNCTKKKHTCENERRIKINCDGYFDFCNKKYNGNCLCGVEILNSGYMVTKAD